MREEVWHAAGFDAMDTAASTERCGKIFADALGGRPLRSNNSSWLTFRTVVNAHWSHGNTVPIGDAAHTAHFSIGSGTKLAVEDALALAACIEEQPDLPAALAAYEAERRPVVASTQRAAAASLRWFEELGTYVDQAPRQFAFNLLTRSRRVTHDNLRLRDAFTAAVEEEFGCAPGTPPMFTPLRLRGLELRNRVVVSPMDMYSAVDGVPGDLHLVHLGARALGGAGLVMTEMVCVSAEGRITPGCTGLYTPEQAAAWTRITDFVHTSAPGTAIGIQLGHSGRKGSTKLMWEGIDQPLDEGNWPLSAASPIPYREGVNQVPHALDRAGLDVIRNQFAAAARHAATCDFDLLELHCAHGYLLSGFLSPLTNHRTDIYGGPLSNRLRFPLEVFDAVRAQWPDDRPMTVRISATDWAAGGTTTEDAVEIARAFVAHGAGHRRLHRPGRPGRRPRVRPLVPDPVRRPDPQHPGRARHRGRCDLLLGRRQLTAAGEPRRPVRPGPPASVRPALDPARGGRPGLRRTGRALAAAVPRGQPHTADRPHGRTEAAAHSGVSAPPVKRSWQRQGTEMGRAVPPGPAVLGRQTSEPGGELLCVLPGVPAAAHFRLRAEPQHGGAVDRHGPKRVQIARRHVDRDVPDDVAPASDRGQRLVAVPA